VRDDGRYDMGSRPRHVDSRAQLVSEVGTIGSYRRFSEDVDMLVTCQNTSDGIEI
jgi:hypothetical protein